LAQSYGIHYHRFLPDGARGNCDISPLRGPVFNVVRPGCAFFTSIASRASAAT
jgi:hypothetical protein